jgi:tRNA-Thr(GGU) m(6)t(6)A37 methyltransferase TsaA
LWFCHHTRGWRSQVQPPRDTSKRGLFATRAPARPNPIGLSCVRLLRIHKRVLHVGDHDILDGSPILDLKPYLPYCDSVPEAAIGYVADLPAGAPDHREWWSAKGTPPPRVYRRGRE